MSTNHVILLLGSNLGDKEKNIYTAIDILEKEGMVILKNSKILRSEPVGFASSNIFCNIATSINTHFSPVKLLKIIKKIEKQMGRLVDSSVLGVYSDRIIDIDIVTYNNIIFETKKLKIPHKSHLFERDFSMELINNLGK